MISPNPLMSGLIILRVQFNVLVDGPQPNSGILIINLLDDITLLHVPPVKKKIHHTFFFYFDGFPYSLTFPA